MPETPRAFLSWVTQTYRNPGESQLSQQQEQFTELCSHVLSGCSLLFSSAEKIKHCVERNGKIFIAKSLDTVSLKMMHSAESLKLIFIKKRETKKCMHHDE